MKADALEKSLSGAQARTRVSSLLGNVFFLSLTDLGFGLMAYVLAWLVRLYIPLPYTLDLLPAERWDVVSHPWLLLAASQIFFLYIFSLYDDLRVTRHREITSFIFLACLLQMISVTSFFYLTNRIFPRSIIVLFDFFNIFFLSSWRIYVKSRLTKQLLRVLVVGDSLDSTRQIINDIEKSPWMGLKVVGVVVGPNAGTRQGLGTGGPVPDCPILGTLDSIHKTILHYDIDQLIFTSEESWKDRVLNSISQLQEESPVRIAILPSVYEIVIGRLRHVNIRDTPLLEVKRNPAEPFERFLKRSFDITLSVFCLFLLLPFFLVVAALIKFSSNGPVFYLQERVGFGEKIFRPIKFRTMIPEAEKFSGETQAAVDDPRVTRLGRILRRFRIDELPQLLNVLRGDMSFVGPRPERPGFVKEFQEGIPGYNERHKVKPGLTGLAQVRSHYHTTVENKLKYDLAYIYNYSFSLDLLILLETIKVVLTRRGS